MSTAIQSHLFMPATASTRALSQTAQASAASDDALWEAVLQRDSHYDGIMFYGVLSTGVYCRPTCPSRRPRRENVRFFAAPDAAEARGLRACRRCRPLEMKPLNDSAEKVKQVCDYIEKNLEGTLTLQTIAAAVGGSPFHLQRTFKQALGITPHEYAEARRVALFKAALRFGQSVVDATYEAGFQSSSRLYERANAHLGMSPKEYQKGGVRQQISSAVVESPLGLLLVAATPKGVCKISLGKSKTSMLQEMRGEFKNATFREDEAALQSHVSKVLDFLRGKQSRLELPLDLQATAFQVRVWQELQKIPFGQTRSYEEIAQRLQAPRATRAVARACATNPVALVVPCHRVVRKNGGLGGYRWGIERKKRLLAQEQKG
jgi:AraC family transcriptional regulator of adaptative response/methylated-DNA-[protein]-cysteine methyltransferase